MAIFFFTLFLLPPLDTRPLTPAPSSLDHLIRSRQHIGRNCQVNLLGGFEIDDEFKLRCLLYWEVRRFGTFQNLVNVVGGLTVLVLGVHPIKHEAALMHILLIWVNSR